MRKKIAINKCIIDSTKTVMWGFHWPIFEEPGLSGLWVSSRGLLHLKVNAVSYFETSGESYWTTQRNKPEDAVHEYEKSFATNKIFRLCVMQQASRMA